MNVSGNQEGKGAAYEGKTTNVYVSGNRLQFSSFCPKGEEEALRAHLDRFLEGMFQEDL
ncbi:hypothetical protein [Paenibacillus sp. 7541]|uniref:hypothetical protein n=1 Tax=Paenibacillus sp. 7541 TaxID=2026236 RepID=UPI001595D6CE|nr:hypothetical protein [Paenibacillus sp. 7541]